MHTYTRTSTTHIHTHMYACMHAHLYLVIIFTLSCTFLPCHLASCIVIFLHLNHLCPQMISLIIIDLKFCFRFSLPKHYLKISLSLCLSHSISLPSSITHTHLFSFLTPTFLSSFSLFCPSFTPDILTFLSLFSLFCPFLLPWHFNLSLSFSLPLYASFFIVC